MTYENNNKYIGEAWIENEEEEEFKKSFLKGLLEQWQGHTDDNSGFNADRLDGYHYNDIHNEIENAVEPLMNEFEIGYVEFRNTNESTQYYLGFDGVKLFIEGVEGYTDNNKILPWKTEPEEQAPDLYEVFASLYNTLDAKKTDIDVFNEFKDYAEEQFAIFNNIVEALSDNINEDGTLNADTVNGLRFFIVTQAQYNEMKNSSDPAVAAKVRNIHNIFIIRSHEDIVNGGYPDGVYGGNPDINVIDKYYQFRVAYATTIDDETGEEIRQKWLQYKHQDGEDWMNICPTKDFMDENYLAGIVVETLKNRTDYVLNQTAFNNSLRNVPVSDASDFPLINYTRNKFIKGAFYTENNTTSNIPVTVKNGFNFLDLSSFLTSIDGKITQKGTDISGELGLLENHVYNTSDTNIQANADEITRIKGGDGQSTLYSLNSSITGLDGRIGALESLASQREKVKILPFNKIINKVEAHNIFTYDNAGIVFVKQGIMTFMYVYISAKTGFTYKQTNGVPNYIKISTKKVPDDFLPLGNHVWWGVESWNSQTQGVLEITGKNSANRDSASIYYANTTSKATGFNILGTFAYISQLPDDMELELFDGASQYYTGGL